MKRATNERRSRWIWNNFFILLFLFSRFNDLYLLSFFNILNNFDWNSAVCQTIKIKCTKQSKFNKNTTYVVDFEIIFRTAFTIGSTSLWSNFCAVFGEEKFNIIIMLKYWLLRFYIYWWKCMPSKVNRLSRRRRRPFTMRWEKKRTWMSEERKSEEAFYDGVLNCLVTLGIV